MIKRNMKSKKTIKVFSKPHKHFACQYDAFDAYLEYAELVGHENALIELMEAIGIKELEEIVEYIFRVEDYQPDCEENFGRKKKGI